MLTMTVNDDGDDHAESYQADDDGGQTEIYDYWCWGEGEVEAFLMIWNENESKECPEFGEA